MTAPGKFNVVAELATNGRSRFSIAAGDSKIACEVPNTGGYDQFRELDSGTLELGKAGGQTLVVTPDPGGWSPLNVRCIVLEPCK